MVYIQSASILPLRAITSRSRLLTGGTIIAAGLLFAANNMLYFA